MKKYNIYLFIIYFIYLLNIISCNYECPSAYNKKYFKQKSNNEKNVRVVQYNVEWLFVEHYSNFDCPGERCTWKNKTHALEHLTDVSKVISELEPDILNLCEVEGCNELDLIVKKINNSNSQYKSYLKYGTDVGTGQNVGMISKITPEKSLYRNEERIEYPVLGSDCGYSHSSTTGLSKHYITEFKLNNIDIAFIGTHLIAYPLKPDRCSQREAQAQILQNIVFDYVNKNYEVIVIGDMNDYDNEILDVNSNKPTSMALDIIKGIKGKHSSAYELISVANKIQMSDRYSEWWNSDDNCETTSIKEYSMIDHILVTPNLFNYIDNAFIYHGYQEYCDKIHSDHFPVVVDFKF